jgi:hypothetical protein
MQLQKVFQPAEFIKSILHDDPSLIQKYVGFGASCVSHVLAPVGVVLKHLLEVQNLDPSSEPGSRYQQALEDAINKVVDDKDFDTDFDLSWVYKKWEETNRGLKNFKLTQQKFQELTDLNNVSDKPVVKPAEVIVNGRVVDNEDEFFSTTTEVNRVAPPTPVKREIPIAEPLDQEARQARRAKILADLASRIREEKYVAEEDEKFNYANPLEEISEVVDKVSELEKLIQKMEAATTKNKIKTSTKKKVNRSAKVHIRPLIEKGPRYTLI